MDGLGIRHLRIDHNGGTDNDRRKNRNQGLPAGTTWNRADRSLAGKSRGFGIAATSPTGSFAAFASFALYPAFPAIRVELGEHRLNLRQRVGSNGHGALGNQAHLLGSGGHRRFDNRGHGFGLGLRTFDRGFDDLACAGREAATSLETISRTLDCSAATACFHGKGEIQAIDLGRNGDHRERGAEDAEKNGFFHRMWRFEVDWKWTMVLERAAGIEPACLAWKARALPLSYARAVREQ